MLSLKTFILLGSFPSIILSMSSFNRFFWSLPSLSHYLLLLELKCIWMKLRFLMLIINPYMGRNLKVFSNSAFISPSVLPERERKWQAVFVNSRLIKFFLLYSFHRLPHCLPYQKVLIIWLVFLLLIFIMGYYSLHFNRIIQFIYYFIRLLCLVRWIHIPGHYSPGKSWLCLGDKASKTLINR